MIDVIIQVLLEQKRVVIQKMLLGKEMVEKVVDKNCMILAMIFNSLAINS